MEGAVVLAFAVGYGIWYFGTKAGKEKQARENAERAARLAAPPGVVCPSCASTSVQRMTLGTRAASGIAGGLLFSKGARAQFRCNNCRYLW